MRPSRRPPVILLTLLFSLVFVRGAHATPESETATCAQGDNETLPNFGWMNHISQMLDASAGSKPPVTPPPPPPAPKPVVVTTPPPVAKPAPESSAYDLGEPELGLLQMAALASAKKCRTDLTTRTTICGDRKSKYQCYRGVKDALVGAGLVDAWWSEDAAVDAGKKNGSLVQRGFTNVMSPDINSENAPLGAVLVYSGGAMRCPDDRGRPNRKQCGHIEIKIDANKYCSDYCKAIPADGYLDRKLIGVYVKE